MINEETIVSVYNDKMTLLQFLKTVNKALDEAVLTSVEVSKKGNATLSFVFEFADGTKIESGEIVLQQGESVTDAKIVDGHLYLTLSNDERLDAGNVKPVTRFEINASQHLIVYYGDGTSQDLGAILQGNVNIDGNLTANSIIENMGSDYNIQVYTTDKGTITPIYASICKNGNKLTLVFNFKFTKAEGKNGFCLVNTINMPSSVGAKLIPYGDKYLDMRSITATLASGGTDNIKSIYSYIYKWTDRVMNGGIDTTNLDVGVEYFIRQEVTFLLGDSLL